MLDLSLRFLYKALLSAIARAIVIYFSQILAGAIFSPSQTKIIASLLIQINLSPLLKLATPFFLNLLAATITISSPVAIINFFPKTLKILTTIAVIFITVASLIVAAIFYCS